MLLWNPEIRDGLTTALDRARAGEPTVLVVQAPAGLGKTALLRELAAQAREFRVQRADGSEDDQTPYALLAQWGADPTSPDGGEQPSLRMAAQALRNRLDALAVSGPVLLVADDLHWADPESVEALLSTLRRTSGDQLLVAVGTRPLTADVHAGWQRWTSDRDAVIRIELRGLNVDQVADLARRRWPELPDGLAGRLHDHTDGNPLYLTMLLAENDLSTLTAPGVLPAPAAFARSMALRTARLSASAVDLLRATCVLGSGWTALPLAASTAELLDPAAAAQELVEAGLIVVRREDGPPQLRAAHALVRASVHQQTPLPELKRLNARAAGLVATEAARLQHRMAAAEQYDSALADELEAHAAELYRRRSFRPASQYLRWASALTPQPAIRERRWLESIYDAVLGFDFSTVDAEADDVRRADDVVWRGLVLGLTALWRRRYRDGLEELEPVATVAASAEPGAAYRVEVLLAWARLCLGQPTSVIAEGLARVSAVRVDDVGLQGLDLVVSSQVSIRRHGIMPALEQLSNLPAAAATPLPATRALAYRGSLRAVMGLLDEAEEDLVEATHRITRGVTDLGAGSFHAQLGLVQWLTGDWGRSRVSFNQAFDIAGPVVHQMTAALAPLVDIGTGRFAEADALMARSRELLTESPWTEACHQFLGTVMTRLHAGGSRDEQASALADLQGTPFVVPDITRLSPTVLLNYVPALVWAGRLDEADLAASRLLAIKPSAPWFGTVAQWYAGLIWRARGDRPRALAELTAAVQGPLGMPLYRAHLLADHGTLARTMGRPDAATSLRQAEDIYTRLRALPYLERVRALPVEETAAPESLPGGVTLTDREHDVLVLLMSGMSYAQISRELFITQSTVGYHLGNIYGKAGVSSRHQLTQAARQNPKKFGISLRP